MKKRNGALNEAESQIDAIEEILKDARDDGTLGDYDNDRFAVLFAETPAWADGPERTALSFGYVADGAWHEAGRVALDVRDALNPGCLRFGNWDWNGNVDGQEISSPLAILAKSCRWIPRARGCMLVKPTENSPSHEELLKVMARSVNAAYEGISSENKALAEEASECYYSVLEDFAILLNSPQFSGLDTLDRPLKRFRTARMNWLEDLATDTRQRGWDRD